MRPSLQSRRRRGNAACRTTSRRHQGAGTTPPARMYELRQLGGQDEMGSTRQLHGGRDGAFDEGGDLVGVELDPVLSIIRERVPDQGECLDQVAEVGGGLITVERPLVRVGPRSSSNTKPGMSGGQNPRERAEVDLSKRNECLRGAKGSPCMERASDRRAVRCNARREGAARAGSALGRRRRRGTPPGPGREIGAAD